MDTIFMFSNASKPVLVLLLFLINFRTQIHIYFNWHFSVSMVLNNIFVNTFRSVQTSVNKAPPRTQHQGI